MQLISWSPIVKDEYILGLLLI